MGQPVLYLACSQSASSNIHTLGTPNYYYSGGGKQARRNRERLTLPWWSVFISTSLRVAWGFLLPVNTEIRFFKNV